MKKITNLLIVCSLALVGAVMAQQPAPEESQPPGKKSDKQAPAEAKPKAPQAPKAQAPAAKEPPAPPKAEKPETKAPSTKKPEPVAAPPETKTEQPAASAMPDDKKQQSAESPKDKKAPAAAPKTAATASPAAARTTASPVATTATTPASATTPAAAASTAPAAGATAAPSVSQTSPTKPVDPTAAKKPDPQKVEQIKTRHASFRAQARPDRVPPVTFSVGFRIEGSDRWQGPQYEVYRSYRPERHDQSWYRSRYQRVELIAGGYYYFNSGYWYPAWGYSPAEEYYAYDAPIYVGKRAEPPDKVIANVQAVLQEMGYYKGEVDGLLGPLTRAALTGYQNDQGLTATAVIDQPTLDSLGMG